MTRNGNSERVEGRAPRASLTRRVAGISADDGNQSDAHREGSGMLLYERLRQLRARYGQCSFHWMEPLATFGSCAKHFSPL